MHVLAYSLWVHPIWDSASWTWVSASFLMLGNSFRFNIFKYILRPLLFLFSWDPYNVNVGVFNIAPEVKIKYNYSDIVVKKKNNNQKSRVLN